MVDRKGLRAAWPFDFVLDIATAALALVGCAISFRHSGFGMLQYYTVDSNLLGVAACVISAYYILRRKKSGREIPPWAHMLKYVAVCCLMVTFLVVLLALAPMAGGAEGYRVMFTERDMLYHHLLCPLLILLSFLLFGRVPRGNAPAALYALIPTGAYALVTVVLNLIGAMDGPYPFLHVYEQPFFVSCLWFVAILGGAFAVAFLLAAAAKRLHAEADGQKAA